MDANGANDFINQSDISFNPIVDNNSIKSNILILSKNFNTLAKYLSNLKAFAVFIYNLIDIDKLISTVLANIQSSKTVLLIDSSKNIGEVFIQTVNGVDYQIIKIDDYTISVTIPALSTWAVDNLIVQVKNLQGTIVYPVITTIDNSIHVNFNDGFSTNYKLFFI